VHPLSGPFLPVFCARILNPLLSQIALLSFLFLLSGTCEPECVLNKLSVVLFPLPSKSLQFVPPCHLSDKGQFSVRVASAQDNNKCSPLNCYRGWLDLFVPSSFPSHASSIYTERVARAPPPF